MQMFTGYITDITSGGAGFTTPVSFAGPPGWTVCKEAQNGIFKVTHNLKLTNPNQLHITVTVVNPYYPATASIDISANYFRVTCTSSRSDGEVECGLMFIAAYYPHPFPKP